MSLPHESLVAWQRADDLFLRIHTLTRTFPAHERYELGTQSRRAAFSVPANIVEGFARYPPKERAQFLRIALASLAELSYCMHVARRLEYITAESKHEIDRELLSVDAPLRGLLRSKEPTGR
jgi:four helix bundle protein